MRICTSILVAGLMLSAIVGCNKDEETVAADESSNDVDSLNGAESDQQSEEDKAVQALPQAAENTLRWFQQNWTQVTQDGVMNDGGVVRYTITIPLQFDPNYSYDVRESDSVITPYLGVATYRFKGNDATWTITEINNRNLQIAGFEEGKQYNLAAVTDPYWEGWQEVTVEFGWRDGEWQATTDVTAQMREIVPEL